LRLPPKKRLFYRLFYIKITVRKCLFALKKVRFWVLLPGGYYRYSAGRQPSRLRRICGGWSLRPVRSIWESDLQKKSVGFSDLSGCENFNFILESETKETTNEHE
jgi:hypothetical protein